MERDERLVDLLQVPYWLAKPALEQDKRLDWHRLDAEEAETVSEQRQEFVLARINETLDGPIDEIRKAVVHLGRQWTAFCGEVPPDSYNKVEAALNEVVRACNAPETGEKENPC